jgi:uncharacterized membrane protein
MQTRNFNNGKTEKQAVLLFTIWGLVTFLVGYTKVYANLPRQLFGLTVFVLLATLIVLYFRNQPFKHFADGIPLKYIALFHAWRIFAGLVFLAFQNELPPTFVHEAAWGDIISGFLGIVVFIFAQNKIGYLIFNVIGLLDLILAMGLGMSFALTGDPKMAGIVALPLILIPLYGVPITAFTHIFSLARLFKSTKQ